MAKTIGTLGEFFPETDIRCRIKGCNNVWHFSGETALQNVAAGKDARPERMCDSCYSKYKKLTPVEVPCAAPDCNGVWIWTPMRQLSAQLQGYKEPPKGFCENCLSKLQDAEDIEVECRIRGCKNKWVWPAKKQLLSGDNRPPSRLCDECYHMLRNLEPREIPCRIDSCRNSWLWNEFEQIEYLKSGKNLDEPPKRMCRSCYHTFKGLQDIELPCKVEECNRTWTFRAFDQLQHQLSNGADAPPPAGMCKACFAFTSRSRNRSIRCRNRGCSNTWSYSRKEQLHDWLNGNSSPVPRMCKACQDKMEELDGRQVACSVPGCDGTWLYSAEDQVKDLCLGRNEPLPHRCEACERFLAEHQSRMVVCKHCGREISWSSYEQLLCHHGTFVVPEKCTYCAEQELALGAQKEVEDDERIHHHVVKMPASGLWQRDERIRNWPKHLDYEAIQAAEKADVRIVAIGDDITFSAENKNDSWPYLLEKRLNEHFKGERSVVVVNTGIPKSTTRQALLRYQRDIAPFAPHLIIFSFAFADAYLHFLRDSQKWKANVQAEELHNHVEAWCQKLKRQKQKALCWIPNPLFPEDREEQDWDVDFGEWSRAQNTAYAHVLRLWRQVCTSYNLPVADLHSRFEVNGSKSAKKWLADWYFPNKTGAQNIARWLAEFLICNDLL